ncbi:hypothetical protein JCM8097_008831 [Rhodosporidiobolus ruineniae]
MPSSAPSVVPYDRPPSQSSSRSFRRPSSAAASSASRPPKEEDLLDRLSDALVAAEHIAGDVEHAAHEVGRAARVGREVEGVVEREYGRGGAAGQSATMREGGREEGTETERSEVEEERPLKQGREGKKTRKPPPTLRSTAPDDLDAFEQDLDDTQEAIDSLSDLCDQICLLRHRLTGGCYPRVAKLLRLSSRSSRTPAPRPKQVELEEATDLAALVSEAKEELLGEYRAVCALQPRYAALSASLRSAASSSPSSRFAKSAQRVQKHFSTLNASYAALLDFVEDRAKEERADRDGGECDGRLLRRMEEEQPGWERERRLVELSRAKKAARGTSLGRVDLSTYTGWYLLDNPFTELDAVLATIDNAENGLKAREDEKTGSWALGSKLAHAFHLDHRPSSFSLKSRHPRSSPSKRTALVALEAGRSHRSRSHSSSSHQYRSDPKPSPLSLSSSDSEPDVDADEKKLLAGLPERVPTDDTTGYQESERELLEDARRQARTEHFYTPLLVLWWAGITILYLYYLIARLGFGLDSPLGNVDLGRHLGNEAWYDTTPLSSITASLSSTASAAASATGVEAAVSTAASAAQGVMSSVSAAGEAGASTTAALTEGTSAGAVAIGGLGKRK